MKLKQLPEDFQVEELTEVTPGGQGPFAFYRLEKSGWTTLDAIQAIRRRWKLDLRRVSYGGLKDRHALTVQYLTIFHGPQRGLTHHGISLQYLGPVTAPYKSKDIRANRFRITLRALTLDEVELVQRAVAELRADGVPNYFDEQRFGSVGDNKEFVARYMVQGNYEGALRLALAGSYRHDRAAQKQEKAVLRSHWGDWATCKERLPRGHARSLADYLVHHAGDFKGALARLRPELRGLYLSAYQSYLWNRMLARRLLQWCRPEQLIMIRSRLGDLALPRGLDAGQRAELAGLVLPLPSARLKIEASDPLRPLVDAVLAEEGLKLDELKLKGLREPFFSKGERPGFCHPSQLEHESGADEHNPGCQKLVLSFELPRGSYATLLVKRVQAALRGR